MTSVMTRDDFGGVLRTWRGRRSQSQLSLATEAGVSQRHISFLETGRSRPSREMVMHLGLVLDVPLRERNTMLVSAGFAPVYPERSIDHPDLVEVRQALQAMLSAHNPYPAYVIDRHWNLVLANEAAGVLISNLPEAGQLHAGNILTLTLHPDGLRSACTNWESVAAAVLHRVQAEIDENPGDIGLVELFDQVSQYPGLPTRHVRENVPSMHELIIPMNVDLNGTDLSFFTAISTLMSPSDITLQELRLETLLPANAATAAVLHDLVGPAIVNTQ